MSECEPTYEELLSENRALKAQVRELEGKVKQLSETIKQLLRRIEELEGKPPVSAAPFRVPDKRRKRVRKRRGRRKGHKGASRAVPDRVDQVRDAPHERCPQCGCRTEILSRHEQYVEELLPPRHFVVKFISYRLRCPSCGPVQSRSPGHPPPARGCAKVRIGPGARALASYLKASLGLTLGKIRRFFAEFDMTVTEGWLASVRSELAAQLEGTWRGLLARVRAGPSVHADETSWYVGEPGWLLWVFARPETAVYLVEPTRSSQVVQRMLGDHYDGVLVSDCMASYDPIECRKQKCYSHHLKALGESIERLAPEHTAPLTRLQSLLRASVALGHTRGEHFDQRYRQRVSHLKAAIDEILDGIYPHTGVDKALHRFRKHREHLFTHLEQPGVDATNNLAERLLRFAVITRKLSCGNRTERGARIWQVLTSVAATCRQRGQSFLKLAHRSFRDPKPETDLLAA